MDSLWLSGVGVCLAGLGVFIYLAAKASEIVRRIKGKDKE